MKEYKVTFTPITVEASSKEGALERALIELRLSHIKGNVDVEITDTHALCIVFDDACSGLYVDALEQTPAQIEEAGGSFDLYRTLLPYHGDAFMEEHGFEIINDSTLYNTPFEKLINKNWILNYFYGDEEEE